MMNFITILFVTVVVAFVGLLVVHYSSQDEKELLITKTYDFSQLFFSIGLWATIEAAFFVPYFMFIDNLKALFLDTGVGVVLNIVVVTILLRLITSVLNIVFYGLNKKCEKYFIVFTKDESKYLSYFAAIVAALILYKINEINYALSIVATIVFKAIVNYGGDVLDEKVRGNRPPKSIFGKVSVFFKQISILVLIAIIGSMFFETYIFAIMIAIFLSIVLYLLTIEYNVMGKIFSLLSSFLSFVKNKFENTTSGKRLSRKRRIKKIKSKTT